MYERSFDEMIAYFNRRVSEMDISQDYKMELLGMVTALGYKHEKSAQPERKAGKWIKHISDIYPADSTMECNVCHAEQTLLCDDNYCPNCGAKMEVEE